MLRDKTQDRPEASRGSSDTITFLVKKDIKALLEEGKRRFDEGEIALAIEIYESALANDPNCALLFFNLGFAYHELKDYNRAKEYYLKAIELEPECSLFQEHLGRLYFERGDYPAAITTFRNAIEIGQVQPICHGLLGRAYYKSEDFEEAVESLTRMLEMESSASLVNVARYHLILSLLKLSNMFRARSEAETLLRVENCDLDILQNLGDEFSRNDCISLAKRFFERMDLEEGKSVLARSTVEKIRGIEIRIDEIIPRLYDNDEEQVLRSVHALMDVGHEKVARALLSLRFSDSALVRESVVEYLRKYGFPAAAQVVEMLNDESAYVREKASHFVAEALPSGLDAAIRPHLSDRSPIVRRNLATYFSRTGGSEVLVDLRSLLDGEADPDTRESLSFAVDAIQKREVQSIAERRRKLPPMVFGRARFRGLGYGLLGLIGAAAILGLLLKVL